MRPYESFRSTSIPANVVVATEYKAAETAPNFVVDDYQSAPESGFSSSGGAVAFSVNALSEVQMRDQAEQPGGNAGGTSGDLRC